MYMHSRRYVYVEEVRCKGSKVCELSIRGKAGKMSGICQRMFT